MPFTHKCTRPLTDSALPAEFVVLQTLARLDDQLATTAAEGGAR